MNQSKWVGRHTLPAGLLLAGLAGACGGHQSAGAADDGAAGNATAATADGDDGGAAPGPSGSDPGGSSALPTCPSTSNGSYGDAKVYDANGEAPKDGLTEQVTVTAAEFSLATDSPPSASYTIETSSGAWTISVTHTELSQDLVQVGDELELRLASWPGYVPLTTWQNQAFGLFDESGALLLFGVDARELALPVPDLSLLGLELEDAGGSCFAASSPCSWEHHQLRIGSGDRSVELMGGKLETLGALRVLLTSAGVPSSSGGCDASSITRLVGIASP